MDFGDGVGTSTAQTPSCAYVAGGSYAVSLTVSDDGSATKNVTVSSGGSGSGVLYVSDISMTHKTAGPNRSGMAIVTIRDSDGQLVEGATVDATWSGDYAGSSSGVTGTDGTVSFESGKVRQANASFTFPVDAVSKTGYTYDPGMNVETGDSSLAPKWCTIFSAATCNSRQRG